MNCLTNITDFRPNVTPPPPSIGQNMMSTGQQIIASLYSLRMRTRPSLKVRKDGVYLVVVFVLFLQYVVLDHLLNYRVILILLGDF